MRQETDSNGAPVSYRHAAKRVAGEKERIGIAFLSAIGVAVAAAGMPVEIAKFSRAVNASFDTVRDLVGAKVFTSAISQEVRTPLAISSFGKGRKDPPRRSCFLSNKARCGPTARRHAG